MFQKPEKLHGVQYGILTQHTLLVYHISSFLSRIFFDFHRGFAVVRKLCSELSVCFFVTGYRFLWKMHKNSDPFSGPRSLFKIFFIHGTSWVFHIFMFLKCRVFTDLSGFSVILSTRSTFFSKKMFENLFFNTIRLFCTFFTKNPRSAVFSNVSLDRDFPHYLLLIRLIVSIF